MLKKLKKALEKEFTKRYEQLEEQYLGFENKFYSKLEMRLSNLEEKFDELSDLLKEEIHARKQRNVEKQAGLMHADDESPVEEAVEEAKEMFAHTVQDTKEEVTEKAEEVIEKIAKGVKKAKAAVEETMKEVKDKAAKDKKGKKKADKKKTKKEAVTEETIDTPDNSDNDDLTALKGLGEKMAEKLIAEGITSYAQLAQMTAAEIDTMEAKIKSFAARFNRYEWNKQAKELIK